MSFSKSHVLIALLPAILVGCDKAQPVKEESANTPRPSKVRNAQNGPFAVPTTPDTAFLKKERYEKAKQDYHRFKKSVDDAGVQKFAAAFGVLAGENLPEALKLLDEFPPGTKRHHLLGMLERFAEAHPLEILNHLVASNYPEDEPTIREVFRAAGAKISLDEALNLIETLPATYNDSAKAVAAGIAFRKMGMVEALKWSAANGLTNEVAGTAAIRQPVELTQYAAKHPTILDLPDLRSSLPGQLLAKAPEVAVKWVVDLGRPDYSCSLVITWCNIDSQAASEWVRTLAPGPAKDGAISGLIEYLRGIKDDAGANAWQEVLSDAKVPASLGVK